MKTLTAFLILFALGLASPVLSFATVNVDSSDNYSGGWTNGSNGGGGFGAWSNVAVSGSGWAGNGIWASSNAYLGMGDAFGYVAKGTGSYITLSRNFSTALASGDVFSLEFGLNYDTGNPAGNKGFVLYTADNREIVVVNQSNSQNIAINGTAALTNYGTATMHWTFTQTSPTQVTVYATGRGGESEYVTRIISTSQASYISGIKFYASEITNDTLAEYRQVYFDNLTLSQGTASSGDVFTYAIANGKATITAISQTASNDLVVPATLGSYPVTAIARAAGAFCTNITSLSFVNGGIVTNIGPNAFQGCTALLSAALPAGLTTLSESVFYGCTALTTVTLPSGLTEIFDSAFAECRALSAVTLPDGLARLGESVFLNCRALTALDFPDGLTEIPGQCCYECRALGSVTFPGALENIGYFAFYNCWGLTGLDFPSSLATLEDGAFAGCRGLTTLTFDGTLAEIGSEAFYGCSGLSRIYFLGGADVLDDTVFGQCASLSALYFKSDVPTLASGANLFISSANAAIYYIADPSNWETTLGGVTVSTWKPTILASAIDGDQIDFDVEWGDDSSVVLQICSNLTSSAWQNLATNSLSDGTCVLTDPDPDGHSFNFRFYRAVIP